jgi:hypothetical protein
MSNKYIITEAQLDHETIYILKKSFSADWVNMEKIPEWVPYFKLIGGWIFNTEDLGSVEFPNDLRRELVAAVHSGKSCLYIKAEELDV